MFSGKAALLPPSQTIGQPMHGKNSSQLTLGQTSLFRGGDTSKECKNRLGCNIV